MKTFRRRGGQRWLYGAVALLVVVYGCWAGLRPIPLLQAASGLTQLTVQSATSTLNWPATGQSAVGLVGSPILDTHGAQTPVPTASTAKLITALTVLQAKPLAPGQQGPTITLTANDVAIYNAYLSQDGSLVVVQAGEQISEYQMLEAMLLPSANNMADSLAIWAFGSLPAYSTFANKYVQQLGLTETHIGSDASGFNPSTTSTAHDLVRLGELTMQNPLLAQIVGQPSAGGIPVVGTIKNVNRLLGTDNIIGVKTGNTNQAGGVFISASRTVVNTKPVTVVTALAGTPTLAQAMTDSLPFIQSAQANFKSVPVIQAGSVVGHYQLPWGGTLPVIASSSFNLEAWNGSVIPVTIKLNAVRDSTRTGQTVGQITMPASILAGQQSVPAALQTSPTVPSPFWRLLHPF